MDQRILEAISMNDLDTFLGLVRENEGILEHKTTDSKSTVLHLAAKFGHVDMVSEIVNRCPEIVAAENVASETPIHDACRQGNPHVLKLLIEANPGAAFKLNSDKESAFFLACGFGHLDAVILLMKQPGILDLEEAALDHKTSFIHVASSRGHTDVVREILNANPQLARKIDERGNSALHLTCGEGHREIAWMLLRRDPNLALQYNRNGYTPLHLAAMHGEVSVLEEFARGAPASFQYLTKEEESVFHLAVRYGRSEALAFFARSSSAANLVRCQNRYGNTALHIAVSGGRYQIAEFLINKVKVETDTRNWKGQTALEMLNQTKVKGAESRRIESLLLAGVNRETIIEVSSYSPPEALSSTPSYVYESDDASTNQNNRSSLAAEKRFLRQQGNRANSSLRRARSRRSSRSRKERNAAHGEAVQSARNTVILVAVLIATVTFAAGISPPGGVRGDGKAAAGETKAFKVFAASNGAALFASLSIVVVLVSVIPFKRKPQMRLLGAAHKAMWAAVALVAAAYAAATWVVVPGRGAGIVMAALAAATLGTVFVGLGVLSVKHRLRKLRWRRLIRWRGGGSGGDESQNSDVESSYQKGYHSY